MRETEVLTELNYSLSEWGLGRTGQSNLEEHRRLREQLTHAVRAMLEEGRNQTHDNFEDLMNEQFPATIEQAYEHVLLHHDVDNVPLFICRDSINTSFAPFYRCRRRNDPLEHYQMSNYQRKPQFQKFQLARLDPLNRFDFEKVSKAELFFHQWFVESDASRLGVFMEAAIACHAIHQEKCFHCRHRHALRWKGGGADAWQDLVCTNCQAIYEVKTKETMDLIQRALEFNNIPGGSFRAACRLENSRPASKKRFLILLPRNATNKRGQMVHPVQVEEISKILPAACESTFNNKRSSKAIKSVILVKNRIVSLNRSGHWFNLPQAACARPLKEIAKKVFLERFSKKEYESLKCKYFKTPSTPQSEESKNPPGVQEDEPCETSEMELRKKQELALEALRKKLEEEAVLDWEDRDSDSEDW